MNCSSGDNARTVAPSKSDGETDPMGRAEAVAFSPDRPFSFYLESFRG